MKASLISLLLIGNLASAATEWTTISQKIEGKTGDTCTLKIDSLVVVPPASQEYDDATTKMNALLSKRVNETTSVYTTAVSDLPNRCEKSRGAGGISAELTTVLVFKARLWSSWEQNEAGYLGGAHGHAGSNRLVISEKGDLITFDTQLGISRESFIQLVKTKVAAADRYSEGSFEMWAQDPAAIKNLNYYANEAGVSIFFNSYVIASYAEGPSEISFSWNEMQTILKRDSVLLTR